MEIAIGLIIGLVVAGLTFLIGSRQISALRADLADQRAAAAAASEALQAQELARTTAETKLESSTARVEGLVRERDEVQRELDQQSGRLSKAEQDLAQATEARDRLDGQLRERTQERDTTREQLDSVNAKLSQLSATLAEVEADHQARQEEHETYRAEMETRFTGIATTVTQSTREDFIKEFRDLTKQQSEVSQEAVTNLVKPVRERLAELQKYVDDSDKRREHDYARVTGGVERLLQETTGLRRILHNPSKRGEWGEQHLRNVMEAAGMTDHVDFVEQMQFSSEDGAGRPDVVVSIPGGVQVIVDAKTPFESYDAAMQASDDEERDRLYANHARDLLGHAQTLQKRDYSRWVDGSPDFVLMYVPTDPMLDVAIDANSGVWQEAWEKHRVLIATPGLLIAFMRTVALAWQQQAIQQNAQEIAGAAKMLYDRLATFTNHLGNVGKGLDRAVKAYNSGVGSYEGRVLPQARRIEALGAVEDSKPIEDPVTIDLAPRQLSAPETAD